MTRKLDQVTPLMLIIITAVIGFFGYCGDNAYKGILSSISDLRSENQDSFQKIWARLNLEKNSNDDKFSYIYQQCCAAARVPPPQPVLSRGEI